MSAICNISSDLFADDEVEEQGNVTQERKLKDCLIHFLNKRKVPTRA